MEIKSILDFIRDFDKGKIERVARDIIISFGTERLSLAFSRWLPVRRSDTNEIYEEIMRIGAGVVANDGEPMSPPQIKQVGATGLGMTFKLGHIDIAMQFTAREMKDLSALLASGDRTLAEQFFINWLVTRIRLALEKKTEIQRVQAMTMGVVTVTPIDGVTFNVTYGNLPADFTSTIPSGTTVTPAGWYDEDFNPLFETIIPKAMEMKEKGYEPAAIYCSSRILGVLQRNKQLALMGAGSFRFDDSGNFANASYAGIQPIEGISALFRANGLPAPMTYDDSYETQTGRNRFYPEDNFIMIGRTLRQETINTVDYKTRILKQKLIEGTLGYVGEGVSLGQSSPGVVINVKASELKPVGVYAEGYCERFPVFLDTDAVKNFKVPKPA